MDQRANIFMFEGHMVIVSTNQYCRGLLCNSSIGNDK